MNKRQTQPDQTPAVCESEPSDGNSKPSRRAFVFSMAPALTMALLTRIRGGNPMPSEAQAVKRRGRKAMVIDLDRCIGCNACAVACKAEHGVRLGGFRSWVSEEEVGTYPSVTREFLPRLCNHCKNAPCQKVCPTGATSRRSDGIVMVDQSRCIGCRHCMEACPYNARYFNSQHDPKDEQNWFKARTHGTVDKCDFCSRRVDAVGEPACVGTCPGSARIFGDLEDPGSRVSQLLKASSSATLLEDLGTEPSVFYIGRRPHVSPRG